MKAAFYTLGCKVNQYETQALSETLMREGFEIVPHSEDADIYIINSCTVTAESDKKTRQAVRRFKRQHPDSTVVLTGCMPQAYPKAAEELDSADIVAGNRNNCDIPSLILSYLKEKSRKINIVQHENHDEFVQCSISSFDERTRAAIKIEDGCNRFCSYCIIPYARGRVRSKPLDEIRKEAAALAENGYTEIVLVGINLSSYGTDCSLSLCDAVAAVCEVESIKRVRLGSLEPDHMTEEMVAGLKAQPKLCPQFHISLQSGCTETLRRMNRHYTADEYEEICNLLRSNFEDCTITTDIMVGFAGETDEEFETSLRFAEKIGFEKVHVFPYSQRKGTRAAEFPGQLEKAVKEERAHRMIALTNKIRADFLKSQIGKTVEVLAETKDENGCCTGYTANYTPVKIIRGAECGEYYKIKITAADDDSCEGEII
ncbi:MAG: tRNA (N(6)-L-threonylcarbamoyladenosine(37)-C(2))-methylthiotransferase MtaB [Clostridia bacterium]|nr:tRNA (N(6)-L-threonylcarbamoyladenosine(37)-C(2))-methylthiotransferase MtaB [Clostridia bacterium]